MLIVMAIAVAALLRGEIHMKPTNLGCGDPLHLSDCCRVTLVQASKDWRCRKQPACPQPVPANGLQTIVPFIRRRTRRNSSWPGEPIVHKEAALIDEYICADQPCHSHFSLATRRRTTHSGLSGLLGVIISVCFQIRRGVQPTSEQQNT